MKFTRIIQDGQRRYRVTIEQIQANESTEVYLVRAGEKEIVMKSNRPEVKRRQKKSKITWQLISKNFVVQNHQKASMFIVRLQDLIEEYLDPPPTFQQMRNKS